MSNRFYCICLCSVGHRATCEPLFDDGATGADSHLRHLSDRIARPGSLCLPSGLLPTPRNPQRLFLVGCIAFLPEDLRDATQVRYTEMQLLII